MRNCSGLKSVSIAINSIFEPYGKVACA
jgi:hypothetical protein